MATKKKSRKSSTKKKSSGRKSSAKKSSSSRTKRSSSSKKKSTSRRKYGPKAQKEVRTEMHHLKKGEHKSRKQAIAIGLSKARRAGAKVPRKKAA
jgi:hypothetical protein